MKPERFSEPSGLTRFRSRKLKSIELPIHMMPAMRWTHRRRRSSSSATVTRAILTSRGQRLLLVQKEPDRVELLVGHLAQRPPRHGVAQLAAVGPLARA